ncbi:hypothetical protein BS78_05G128900 [Paspalum vaginatum]|nr:hypothetical protein BS78_05G128900 [Paspalum vaginatum]
MNLPGLDLAVGKSFCAQVWDRFRCRVTSSASSSSFLLLVALDRCKFKLGDSSGEVILQSGPGRLSSEFKALELGDRVFQFSVSCQLVGFMIYRLGQFSCQCFEASFHLLNSSGLAAARRFTTLHQRQEFQWMQVKARKSYAQAVSSEESFSNAGGLAGDSRAQTSPPSHSGAAVLTRANQVPIVPKFQQQKSSVFDRLIFPNGADFRPALAKEDGSSVQISNVVPASSSSCDLDLHLGRSRVSKSSHCLVEAIATLANPVCARCLSPDHRRSSCTRPINCKACLGDGHISAFCFQHRKANRRPSPAEPVVVRPPVFSSFSDYFSAARARLESQGASSPLPPITVTIPWKLSASPLTEESLRSRPLRRQSAAQASMAFHRIDPEPFIPRGMD